MPRRRFAPSTKTPAEKVKGLIALIQIAKREMAMATEVYKGLVLQYGGCESSTQMNESQLLNLLRHMQRAGFKIKPKAPEKSPEADLVYGKMLALWAELHTVGKVRNPEEKALHKYIKRQTGIDRPEWLSSAQATTVIESLKKWLARKSDGGKNGN